MIDAARDAIERNFGFVTRWVTRSAPSWRDLMTANPYLAAGDDPAILHVALLSSAPDPARASCLDIQRSPGDAFRRVGDAIYLRLPNGVARTKLTNAWFDTTLGVVSTMRNWATFRF